MMKEMRTTRLAAALGVAVAGAVASDAVLAQGDAMGQIVTFPYYTVQGGMSTFFNVTNTTTAALAVKVRFHEAVNSRDVLDFNILMSPKDAWTGYILPNANGGATLMTDDSTCTSPIIDPTVGLSTAKLAYTAGNADSGPDTAERSKEGYVELIVMGQCSLGQPCLSSDAYGDQTNLPGIGYLTEHVDGTPRDCVTADSYFAPRAVTGVFLPDGTTPWVPWDGSSTPTNGNPIAAGTAALSPNHSTPAVLAADPRGYHRVTAPYPLKANLTLLDIANGIAGGDAALHLGNIIQTGPTIPARPGVSISYPIGNLVTAQNFPYFLEPTTATAPSGIIWNTAFIGRLETRLSSTDVENEWSSNPANGVATDWVVTFPTKGYHVDQFCNVPQANNNRWRYSVSLPGQLALAPNAATQVPRPLQCATQVSDPTLTPGVDYSASLNSGTILGIRSPNFFPTVAPFEERFADGKSDITVQYGLYDREEGGVAASGTAPSPAPPAVLPAMPNETNIVAFTSVDDPNSATESPNAQPIDASAILGGAPYGWADVSFPQASLYGYPAATPPIGPLPSLPVPGVNPNGAALPVTGFLVKTRTFGTPDSHYGQIQDHGYQPPQAR
jgi:hypothetical protein